MQYRGQTGLLLPLLKDKSFVVGLFLNKHWLSLRACSSPAVVTAHRCGLSTYASSGIAKRTLFYRVMGNHSPSRQGGLSGVKTNTRPVKTNYARLAKPFGT